MIQKMLMKLVLGQALKKTGESEAMEWLRGKIGGKKTYLLALGAVIYGAYMVFIEGLVEEGFEKIAEGWALIFVRQGISKSGQPQGGA